jgi:hypothetical protein
MLLSIIIIIIIIIIIAIFKRRLDQISTKKQCSGKVVVLSS